MKKIIKQIKLFIEYILVLLLFFFLSLLPLNFVSILGNLAFSLFGPLSRSHKITLLKLKNIFSRLKEDEIKNIAKKSWGNLGKTIFELTILKKLVDKKNHKITLYGLENLKTLTEKNEQVIFFGIHQSNWELLVPVIDQLGISVGAIYRHINNKFIDKLILKKRHQSINSKRSFYTPKGKESAKEILSAINNNSSMILLIDQKDTAGDTVKFFDISTKTQTGFIKIARKYNLKLIPVRNTRYNINDFSISFYPPIKPFERNISDTKAMLSIHKIIEKWILENPTQWFWQHNRFN